MCLPDPDEMRILTRQPAGIIHHDYQRLMARGLNRRRRHREFMARVESALFSFAAGVIFILACAIADSF